MFIGNVLALDLATVTGWAWGKPGSVPLAGHTRFGEPGGGRAKAYKSFRLWLDLALSARPAELIVYESPIVPMLVHGRTNIDTIRKLVGFAEHLEEYAEGRFELREAGVHQVRAHFLGHNMKTTLAKLATAERCRQLGWPADDHNAADACALWDYQCCWLRPDLASSSTPLFRRGR